MSNLGSKTAYIGGLKKFETPYTPTYEKIFNDTTIKSALTPTQDLGLLDPNTGQVTPFGNLTQGDNGKTSDSYLRPATDGLLVVVSHSRTEVQTATVQNGATDKVSKTVYLVSQPINPLKKPNQGPHRLPSRFNQAQHIVAEIEFDSPNSAPYGQAGSGGLNAWAVSVNIKNGDATDQGPGAPDNVIGGGCKFLNGGHIQIIGTDANPAVISPDKTYAMYGGASPTPFKFRFGMYRVVDAAGVETDAASSELTVGNQVLKGNLATPPDLATAAWNHTRFRPSVL